MFITIQCFIQDDNCCNYTINLLFFLFRFTVIKNQVYCTVFAEKVVSPICRFMSLLDYHSYVILQPLYRYTTQTILHATMNGLKLYNQIFLFYYFTKSIVYFSIFDAPGTPYIHIGW